MTPGKKQAVSWCEVEVHKTYSKTTVWKAHGTYMHSLVKCPNFHWKQKRKLKRCNFMYVNTHWFCFIHWFVLTSKAARRCNAHSKKEICLVVDPHFLSGDASWVSWYVELHLVMTCFALLYLVVLCFVCCALSCPVLSRCNLLCCVVCCCVLPWLIVSCCVSLFLPPSARISQTGLV